MRAGPKGSALFLFFLSCAFSPVSNSTTSVPPSRETLANSRPKLQRPQVSLVKFPLVSQTSVKQARQIFQGGQSWGRT